MEVDEAEGGAAPREEGDSAGSECAFRFRNVRWHVPLIMLVVFAFGRSRDYTSTDVEMDEARGRREG